MAGLYALNDSKEIALLKPKFRGETYETTDNGVVYYKRDNPKIIFVLTPIPAHAWQNTREQLGGEDYHIIMGLKGKAINEEHIVAAYFPPGTKAPKLFDSKTVDLEAFFYPNAAGSFLTRAWNALRINNGVEFSHIYENPLTIVPQIKTFEYYTLGTQSLFDGITCGTHCAQNMMHIYDLIDEGKEVTLKNLIEKVEDPVGVAQKELKIPLAFNDFVKQAWQDAFMPDWGDEQRASLQFKHYLLKLIEQF